MKRSLRACLLFGLACTMASCSKEPFQLASKDVFVQSCVAQAQTLAGKYGSISPRVVAELFAYAAHQPDRLYLPRNFDPSQDYKLPDLRKSGPRDTIQSQCESIWPNASQLAVFSPQEAAEQGILSLQSTLRSDHRTLDHLRMEMRSGAKAAHDEVVRLREAIHRYQPRALSVHMVSDGTKTSPSVEIVAANAVGRPIDAFLMQISLASMDGRILGVGRIRFQPPVPLGAGSEAHYEISLRGVKGLDVPAVMDYGGTIQAVVRLDDIIASGVPIIGRFNIDPDDEKREVVIGKLDAAIYGELMSLVGFRSVIMRK